MILSLCFLALTVQAVVGTYNPCVSPYSDDAFMYGTFPKNFIWASATASYQVEGGWNASGKGLNIWDVFSHEGRIKLNETGDVACDSYHKWRTDIQLMKNMGLKFYRMSISWARLIPTGIVSQGVNPDGYRYYRGIFEALAANGIQPLVTIYHWDLPQALQNQGGWMNDKSAEWFADYADLCFALFGDKVKYWITFNEPWVVSVLGYGYGQFAPGVGNCLGTCPYIVTHNIIRSHARAWRRYDRHYRYGQNGKVGITFNCDFKVPKATDPVSVSAAERAMQWQLGWFANPIFVNGDYPKIMKELIGNRSKAENLPKSRLPEFREEEKREIKGSYDFFGINMYTSQVAVNFPNDTRARYDSDSETYTYQCSSWPGSGSSWLKYVPWGARGLLNWIRTHYNNPPTIVTENGWSDNNGSTTDPWRVKYYKNYINNVLKAITRDGCNVFGYTAWSLMDNFEWTQGYTQKFGLHYVNFNDPNRPRVPKDSARYFASIIANNGFPGTPTTTPTVPPTTPATAGPNSGCGNPTRIASSVSQTLSSPNYPNLYPSNSYCAWTIVAPSSKRVRISFPVFVTENGYDFVYITDSNGARMESCTGTTCNPELSSGNRLTIMFRSDQTINARGFSATFEAV